MPYFRCPVDACEYHDGNDCKASIVEMECESADWHVALECMQQELRKVDFVLVEHHEQEVPQC